MTPRGFAIGDLEVFGGSHPQNLGHIGHVWPTIAVDALDRVQNRILANSVDEPLQRSPIAFVLDDDLAH